MFTEASKSFKYKYLSRVEINICKTNGERAACFLCGLKRKDGLSLISCGVPVKRPLER